MDESNESADIDALIELDTRPESPRLREAIADKLYRAEEPNQAKYALAVMAVFRLGLVMRNPDSGRVVMMKYTRRELLSHSKVKKKPKAVEKAIHSKEWFRQFLIRIVSTGLVEEDKSQYEVMYKAITQEEGDQLYEFARHAVEGDGMEIKRLLFPNQYGGADDEPQEAESAEEDPEAEPVAGAPQATQDSVKAAELVEIFAGLSEHLKQLHIRMDGVALLESELSAMVTQLRALDSSMSQKLSEMRHEYARVLTVLENEDRALLKALAMQFTELSTRRKSLMNQVGSEATKEEKLIAQLETLLATRWSTVTP